MDGLWDTISTYSPPSANGMYGPSAVFGVFGSTDSWPLIGAIRPMRVRHPANKPLSNSVGQCPPDFNEVRRPSHHPRTRLELHVASGGRVWDVTLHLARGPQCFEDATSISGINQPGNWRPLRWVTWREMETDIIVGGYGEVPRVYRNDIETDNNFLALRFKGHTNNAPGIGAVVRVEADQAVKGNPSMWNIGSPTVSEPYVFAGLGPATKADKVIVDWPSGYTQVVEGLEAGQCTGSRSLRSWRCFQKTARSGQEVTIQDSETETGELNLDAKVKAKVFAGDEA